jgi:RNA polymerase sigma-70 factor (ECF subfamily)
MRSFESAYFREVDRAVAASPALAPQLEDIKQTLRSNLFVGEPEGGGPKLNEFAGRGSLRAWFRVVVSRRLLNLVTRGPREVLVEDDLLAANSLGADPELAYMHRLYREAFRVAFDEACQALDARQRCLLRYSLLQSLTM